MCRISNKIYMFLLASVFVFTTTLCAAEAVVLKPLLINLEKWEAEEPEEMSMDMGGIKMTNATRNYTKNKKSITAVIMVGTNAMTQGHMGNMNMETEEVKVNVSTIDGFQVHTSYGKKDNSGAVIVFLAKSKMQGAMFMLSFKGLSEKEAVSLSKKFNWKKMKESVKKLF